MKTNNLAVSCFIVLLAAIPVFGIGPTDNVRPFMACLGLPVESTLTNSIPWQLPATILLDGDPCSVESSSTSTNRFGAMYRVVIHQASQTPFGSIAVCNDEKTAREYVGLKLGTSSMPALGLAMGYHVSTNGMGTTSIVPVGESANNLSDSMYTIFLRCNIAVQVHGSTNALAIADALMSAGTAAVGE